MRSIRTENERKRTKYKLLKATTLLIARARPANPHFVFPTGTFIGCVCCICMTFGATSSAYLRHGSERAGEFGALISSFTVYQRYGRDWRSQSILKHIDHVLSDGCVLVARAAKQRVPFHGFAMANCFICLCPVALFGPLPSAGNVHSDRVLVR